MVLMLLQRTVGEEYGTTNSVRMDYIHRSSAITSATLLYSASVLDLKMICCFFAHQDIKLSPIKTQGRWEEVSGFRCKTQGMVPFRCKTQSLIVVVIVV